MLKIIDNEVTGSGSWNAPEPNPYRTMKPWQDDATGAARWIVDNATGSDFEDDNGVTYKIRQRTQAELTAASAGNAPENERKRLRTAFDLIDAQGILDLDNKGEATFTHGLNSKWYLVTITPLDAAMPDIHVKGKKNEVTIKGGENNGKVLYQMMLMLPPKGRENQLLTDPY